MARLQGGKCSDSADAPPTVGQHGELVGSAEGALGADVHADGGEAEVAARVVGLRLGQVQVARRLRDEPAAVAPLEEVGELVEEPAVGQRCRRRQAVS